MNNNNLIGCLIIFGLLFYIKCKTSNIETYIPPNNINLNYVTNILDEDKDKDKEIKNETIDCSYNKTINLIRNDNSIKPEEYVSIYDSNFGGLLGTKFGTNIS